MTSRTIHVLGAVATIATILSCLMVRKPPEPPRRHFVAPTPEPVERLQTTDDFSSQPQNGTPVRPPMKRP
jgi:hypothetical protein